MQKKRPPVCTDGLVMVAIELIRLYDLYCFLIRYASLSRFDDIHSCRHTVSKAEDIIRHTSLKFYQAPLHIIHHDFNSFISRTAHSYIEVIR